MSPHNYKLVLSLSRHFQYMLVSRRMFLSPGYELDEFINDIICNVEQWLSSYDSSKPFDLWAKSIAVNILNKNQRKQAERSGCTFLRAVYNEKYKAKDRLNDWKEDEGRLPMVTRLLGVPGVNQLLSKWPRLDRRHFLRLLPLFAGKQGMLPRTPVDLANQACRVIEFMRQTAINHLVSCGKLEKLSRPTNERVQRAACVVDFLLLGYSHKEVAIRNGCTEKQSIDWTFKYRGELNIGNVVRQMTAA